MNRRIADDLSESSFNLRLLVLTRSPQEKQFAEACLSMFNVEYVRTLKDFRVQMTLARFDAALVSRSFSSSVIRTSEVPVLLLDRTQEAGALLARVCSAVERERREREIRHLRQRLACEIRERRRLASAQTRTAQARREESAELMVILESLEDAVLTTDSLGRIEFANLAAQRLLGQAFSDLQTQVLTDRIPQLDLSIQEPQSLSLARSTGPRFSVEVRVSSLQGTQKPKALVQIRDMTAVRRSQEELSDIRERERQWLGQELHDDLGQQATALAFLAEVMAGKLRTNPVPAVKDLGEQIAQLAKQSIGKMRALARGLYPTLLDRSGLVGALNELCSDIQEFYRVQPVLRVVNVNINKSAALHLFRIAQEATTNAIKHGRARKIEIGLETRGDFLVLNVTDNGIGIPLELSSDGVGLRSMRHHAELIEGRLEIESDEGGGTRLSCVVPRLSYFPET